VRRAATGIAALAVALALAFGAAGGAVGPAAAMAQGGRTAGSAPPDPNALRAPPSLDKPPAGRRLSGAQVRRLADALPKIRDARATYPGSYSSVFLRGSSGWQVSYYRRARPLKEIGQVLVDDPSGLVTEAWTGDQVAWTMARGYPGAFGRKVNSPVVWIPLCVLFLVPFVRVRRARWDLLVLLSFSASLVAFNDGEIGLSVPLAVPPLLYLLGRMLWIGLRRRDGYDGDEAAGRPPPEPLRLLVPTAWLAIGIVFLVGFRVGLNLTSSNVIDVGYAGVIGADRLAAGDPLYGAFPDDNEHGDTYGPVTYEAYVPFVQALGWSGRWDDLPAAHAAAIFFDLACLALMVLLGRRVRGPTLGVALGWAWASFPFTLYALNTNANDALVPLFLLLALLAAGRPALRGAAVALGGLAKFASLALLPLFALHDVRRPAGGARGGGGGARAILAFTAGAVLVAALALAPILLGGESLRTMYDRTLGFQAGRGSPFSLWGQYGWDTAQTAWQIAAVVGAVALALVPRRRDVVGLAACSAAVLIALQLAVTHWFYLYVVWFFPLVMLALLGRYAEPGAPAPSHGTSSGEIELARNGRASSPTRTAISHGSSSAVS
jgi:hypothetical protein